jgi:hypothetical protein
MPRLSVVVLAPLALGLLGREAGSVPAQPTSQAAQIELTTDQTRYAPGDRVVVSLTNRAATAAWYNVCPRELQYEELEGWVTVQARPETGTECIAVAYALEPGRSAEDILRLDASLPPGRYRIRYVWVANGAVTAPFHVRR